MSLRFLSTKSSKKDSMYLTSSFPLASMLLRTSWSSTGASLIQSLKKWRRKYTRKRHLRNLSVLISFLISVVSYFSYFTHSWHSMESTTKSCLNGSLSYSSIVPELALLPLVTTITTERRTALLTGVILYSICNTSEPPSLPSMATLLFITHKLTHSPMLRGQCLQELLNFQESGEFLLKP